VQHREQVGPHGDLLAESHTWAAAQRLSVSERCRQ
jgi:hypothetical protein